MHLYVHLLAFDFLSASCVPLFFQSNRDCAPTDLAFDLNLHCIANTRFHSISFIRSFSFHPDHQKPDFPALAPQLPRLRVRTVGRALQPESVRRQFTRRRQAHFAGARRHSGGKRGGGGPPLRAETGVDIRVPPLGGLCAEPCVRRD